MKKLFLKFLIRVKLFRSFPNFRETERSNKCIRFLSRQVGIEMTMIIFSITILFSPVVFTQDTIITKTDTQGLYKLSEVVVSATKNQSSTLEIASSISLIDSAEIANRNASNVFELLKNEYGISFTQQGGDGSLSNISIRGGNSSHTLVLVDGIEVNLPSDPANVYDFANLSADNIQQIEILRGPQSTLYGSNALAGVINILTKKGNGSPNFLLLAEGGSYKAYRSLLGTNGGIDKFNYAVTLGRSASEGFSAASEKYGNTEKDGYRKDNISARFGYDFNKNTELNFFVHYLNSKADYDQFGGMFGDDQTYVFNQEEFSFRGETKFQLLNGLWKQKVGFTSFGNVRKYSFDTSAASIYYSKSLYDGRKYKIDWQNDFQINQNNFVTAGIDFNLEAATSEYSAKTFLSPPDYLSVFPKKETKIWGIFLQDQLKLGENFFSTIGARYDNHNQFGSNVTYQIAPAYIIWETGTKLKATFGTGFKAPSLFYLYDPAYGNPDLQLEKSIGFDLGIDQYLWKESMLIGLNYFQNEYEDLFGFDSNFKTVNIKKAKTNGIEFFINAKPSNDLELKANYTFTNAKDLSDNSPDFNKKLLRRPEHKAGLFVSYSPLQFANINGELIFVGQSEDMNFSIYERVKLDSYVLTNLSANYDIANFLKVFIRMENLFNKYYEEVYGYATPGFSVYGGIKINWTVL